MHPLLVLPLILMMLSLQEQVQLQEMTDEQEEGHLCSRVVNRQLDRIHFKSITHSPEQALIIFEGNRFYRIGGGDGELPADHLQVPEKYERWNERELKHAEKDISFWFQSTSRVTSSPTAAYFFTQGSTGLLFGKAKTLALLLSETMEALFTLASSKATQIFNRRRPAADYAVIARQENSDGEFSVDGFILHRDTWQNSSQYVLYDLAQYDDTGMVKVYLKKAGKELPNNQPEKPKKKRKKNENNPAPPNYYHIQRSTLAEEVLLIQGDSEEEKDGDDNDPASAASKYAPSKSLFGDGGATERYLPVGYRLRNYTFLFDQLLGCVYRLEHETSRPSLATKAMTMLQLKRANIPYERFFRCNGERFPAPEDKDEVEELKWKWPPNRCDLNYLTEVGGGGGGRPLPGGGGGGGSGAGGGISGDWKTVVAIFGGVLLLLILLVAICIVCFGVFICRCCGYGNTPAEQQQQQPKDANEIQKKQKKGKHGRQKKHLLEKAATSVISYMPFIAPSSSPSAGSFSASPSPTTTSSSSSSSSSSSVASSTDKKSPVIVEHKQRKQKTPKKSPKKAKQPEYSSGFEQMEEAKKGRGQEEGQGGGGGGKKRKMPAKGEAAKAEELTEQTMSGFL